MGLKTKIDSLDTLPEHLQELYEPMEGGGYRLVLEDANPEGMAKKNSELLSELKAAKAEAAALKQSQEEAARRALEEQKQYETLYRQTAEEKAAIAAQHQALLDAITKQKREHAALELAAEITTDSRRQALLVKELLPFVEVDANGNAALAGPLAGDRKKAVTWVKTEYDFLADCVPSSGGGAVGGSQAAMPTKKFADMSEAERLELKQQNPEAFYSFLRGKK